MVMVNREMGGGCVVTLLYGVELGSLLTEIWADLQTYV